jgi:predicted DNA-binding protein
MATNRRTTVYLSALTRLRLEEASRQTGRSQADLIRFAVERLLDELQAPGLLSAGVAASDEITGRTARAWLREHLGNRVT